MSGASRALRAFVCQSCRQRLQHGRAFSTSQRANDERATGDRGSTSQGSRPLTYPPRSAGSAYDAASESNSPLMDVLEASPQSLLSDEFDRNYGVAEENAKPHRLHVFAHKHNTHLTLVQPARSAAQTASSRVAGAKVTSAEQRKVVDTLMSLSTGNIGFRKAGRGSYDAAFQLTAFALKQMQEKGIYRDMGKLEVVLRGFGAGREAVTKALLGTEGRHIRGKISAVVDATRLKQGGPRSKKPRRLG